MIESIKNSDFLWVILSIGTLLAIPSTIFTIYTWRRGRKKSEFSTVKTSYKIISSEKKTSEKMVFLYDGKSINDLSVSKIAIWNSGNNEIRKEDIVSDCPLRIISQGDSTILDAEIIIQSDPADKFSVSSIDSNAVELGFDYVNKNDGIVVQIFSCGDTEDLAVDCKIKGGERIRSTEHDVRDYLRKTIFSKISAKHILLIYWGLQLFLSIFAFVVFILMTFGVISNQVPIDITPVELGSKLVPLDILLLLLIVMCCYSIRRLFLFSVPHKLRKYVEIELQNNSRKHRNESIDIDNQ